jgi:hypothetical protein
MQHKMSKNINLDTLKGEFSPLTNVHTIKGGTCGAVDAEAGDKGKERGGTPPKGPASSVPAII